MKHLEMRGISKSFSSRRLYVNVSFTFESGIYCVVGQNGVGKTVLLEMLAGVSDQDMGSIYLSDAGFSNTIPYKRKLAYIPSKPSFFPMTTGIEFLNFISSVRGLSVRDNQYLNRVINGFKLESYLDEKFKNMSLGTQKKLFLTTLAIGENHLYILDEPTNGLDAESCEFLAKILGESNDERIAIVATHDQSLLNRLSPKVIKLSQPPITKFEMDDGDQLSWFPAVSIK